MKKRIVSLLMALVMAVSLLPVSAFAAEVDVPAAQDVPAVEQQNDENTTPDTPDPAEEPKQQDAEPDTGTDTRTFTLTSNYPDATSFKVSARGSSEVVTNKTWELSQSSLSGYGEMVYAGQLTDDTALRYEIVSWELSAGGKKFSAATANSDKIFSEFSEIFTPKGVSSKKETMCKSQTKLTTSNFRLWLATNADITLTAILKEKKVYTPIVASANTSYGTIDNTNGLKLLTTSESKSVWKVTATPKDEWYELSYIADEMGNKFASRDGKTAEITVTEADQKFTAYFAATVAPMYDETPADSVTVNVTISNDGMPLMGADGTILANLDVTVPYFDLDDYGLSNFYRYGTEFGWGSYNNDELIERPTALHAYIYLIERYYMGLPADQCGKGMSNPLAYSKATTVQYMDGAVAYKSGVKKALTVTGSPTSLYMSNFWGHDENLMYFRNHEYPLMAKGWGSTCDYILLSDGDRLDVALFSDWSFYNRGGFNKFSQDAYYIATGETVTTSTFKAATSAGLDGESPALEAIKDLKVAVYDTNWTKLADVTGDGTYTYTFDKAGTYYLMGLDANAAKNDACYAPAITKVTVVGSTEPGKDADGNYLIGSAEELLWFQDYVAKNPNTAVNAALTANVSLASVGSRWSGINGFTGTFDGRGHTITMDGAPLFTTLGNESSKTATVVSNLTITGKVQNDKAGYTGGLANSVTGRTCIRNIVMKANVTGTSGCVGGLVGVLRLSGPEISVENCKNYGTVHGAVLNAGNPLSVGGIVGSTFSNGCSAVITIQGCENHGAVTANSGQAGGIAGAPDDNAIITDCLNTGNVSGITVGGIAGDTHYQTQRIERCYNAGTITGSTVGGIVGTNRGATIDSCYNRGAVVVKGDEEYRYGGGIMGEQTSSNIYNSNGIYADPVTNCYNVGTVSCDKMTDKTYLGAATGTFFRDFNDKPASDFSVYIGGFEVYALEGTCDKITANAGAYSVVVSANKMAFKTAAELKSDAMLTTLGDAFKKDAGNVNNGYPVLVWQVSEACTDHTPGAAVRENEVPATCTKDGSHDEVIYCTVCKTEISRKTITDKAPGHKEQPAVKESVKDATCTVAGSHDEVVYCSVCQTEISRTTVTDKALGHDWDSATGKCKRCETACDHKWTNGKCDTCGYTCQHVGGDAVKEKEVPATCTKDGSHDEVVYCTICKAEVSRTNVVDKATGHKEQPAVKENVKAPTCTVDGSHDEVVYCSVCKEEVSRTNVVDKATGHKWDDGVVTTQPTTGKEGVKTFTCTVCKETKTETIDKLGEDQKDQSAANEAINLINGIGTVTKNSKDKIDAARKAYDGLTEDQKKLVPDSVLKTLTDAEAAYAKLPRSSGSGSSYTGGHTFTTDLEPGSITGVFVDGKKLDSRYYTVSGSDVTLTADYLKTLRSGKHTVKIENATKVAIGSFTLSGSGAVQSSRTGDPGVAIYFAMGAVSFLGSAAWLRKRKET